jgi:hypothetical protein
MPGKGWVSLAEMRRFVEGATGVIGAGKTGAPMCSLLSEGDGPWFTGDKMAKVRHIGQEYATKFCNLYSKFVLNCAFQSLRCPLGTFGLCLL